MVFRASPDRPIKLIGWWLLTSIFKTLPPQNISTLLSPYLIWLNANTGLYSTKDCLTMTLWFMASTRHAVIQIDLPSPTRLQWNMFNILLLSCFMICEHSNAQVAMKGFCCRGHESHDSHWSESTNLQCCKRPTIHRIEWVQYQTYFTHSALYCDEARKSKQEWSMSIIIRP